MFSVFYQYISYFVSCRVELEHKLAKENDTISNGTIDKDHGQRELIR